MAGTLEIDFLSKVLDAVIAVRSEIVLFCIAFGAHYLLFHKPTNRRKSKKEIPSCSYDSVESEMDTAPFSRDPTQVLERSQMAFDRGDHRGVLRCWNLGGLKSSDIIPAAHLAQIVESMQRFKKDSGSILAEITAYLKNSSNASSMRYINRLLEPLAKSLDMDVVDGVLKLLPSLGLEADGRTFEIMIQMRFTTRSFEEVNVLVEQMKNKGVTPTRRTTVMLMKTALHGGKLDEALRQYMDIASSTEDGPPTASEAPTHLATQLVELACRLHRPETVLPCLESTKMPLTTEMVNVLLTECSKTPDLASRVEGLAARLSVGRDGRTYQVLVRNAGTDQGKITQLLDDMAAHKIPCTQELCSTVLSACTQSGDISLADRLYAQLGAGQTPTLQALLRFYADAGQPAKACEVFSTHLQGDSIERRVLLDPRTERALVGAALQCGRQDVASAVLESAPTDTAKHISIIRGCASKGNLREAIGAFRSLQASGAEMTQSLWNTALDACVECRDLNQATRFMKEIEAANMADAVSYNTIIKAYLRAEDLESAHGVMVKMRKAGCAPNHVTYNELINALVRNDRDSRSMQAAWDVVEEMKRDGVQPNRITCSILLKSLKAKSSNADINRAMDLTNQMDEPMDEVLMSSVVEALVRVGKPGLLSQKLSDLHRKGNVNITGAQTFGSLIKAYGHAHDISGAWRCWKEMRSRHVKPTCVTIGCMVEAVATSGDVDGAYELISQLLEDDECRDQMNAVIFGSVIKGYGRMRRMERVWAVFGDMTSRKIQPSVSTYNALIDACTRSGQMHSVAKLVEEMRKKYNIKPNLITYSTMIKGFSQHGDMPSALSTLNELCKTPDLKPDGIVYNTVLEGCAQAGLIVEGERLFREMQDAGVVPTNYTLTVMVRLMSQARRADRAFELVETLTQKYRFRANGHVLNALVQACLASRDLPRAMNAWQMTVNTQQSLDTRTRCSLVRSLLAARDALKAGRVMRSAIQMTEKSNDQHSGWTSQDESLLAEVLAALVEGGPEGVSLGKQLFADVRAAHPKVQVDAAVQRKLLAA